MDPGQEVFNHKPPFQSPAGKQLYLISGQDRSAESVMSKVDWDLVGAELNAASVPKRKNDRDASAPSETDLLKHIEDALLMDVVPSDRASTRRG